MFAQISEPAGGIAAWVIKLIVVVAVVVIGWIILTKAIGFQPPPWLVQIFWIVVAVVVAIIAIKIVLSL
jgi:hypothetical protein